MNFLTKMSLMSVVVSALVITVTACGGGGSSDSTAPAAGVTAATGTASVSGSTATATSGISASSVFKATATDIVDSTTSAVLIIDSNNNGEFGDSADTVLSATVNTDGAFDFGAISVGITGETKAQITVSKQGFAPYTSIITLTDGQSISVVADAASTPLLTEVVNISDLRAAGTLSTSFLEIGTRSSSLGVSSYSAIRSLSEMKALADVPLDGDIETRTIIPLAALPDDVTSIKSETQSFDPTNEEDAAKFPGEYIGVGEGSEGEQRLVSVGFDYMSLTDQNGNAIELDINRLSAASKLLPQAVDYTTCLRTSTRTLYASQLELFKLYGDDDNTTTEFEIPLWYYNASGGNWQYLGQAEVFADSALSVDYNTSSSVTKAYAKMCITENWGTNINLDYSFAPERPVNVCVIAKDQDGNALSDLQVLVKKDTTRDYKYLNADGKAQLALTAGGVVGDYEFSYSGTLTGWNKTSVQSADIVSGGEDGCDNTLNIEVVNPYSATLKVSVKELDGSIAANKYVSVYNYSSNDYFNKGQYTDENGFAEFKVKPNVNYGVRYNGETVDVNINNTVVTPENADNGRIATVTVQEIEKVPEVSVYMYDNSISEAAQSVNFYVYAYDDNGDSISLKSLKLNGTILTEGTDYTVDYKYSYAGYEYFYASLNLSTATVSAITPSSLSAGSYSLEATYSDAKAESIDSQRFVVKENRAPVISSVYLYDGSAWTYINSNINTGTYDISAYTYDPDADAVTLTYMLDDVSIDSSGIVLAEGNHQLVISASDGNLDANKTFDFFVGNNAPEITSFGATSYSIDLASQNTTIKLYAYAQDKDRDTLSVTTTDGTITLLPSYTGSNYFRSANIVIDANKTFSIYANDTDKNSSVKSLTVTTYRANQAPVFDKELTPQQVAAGSSLSLECVATDPEGDNVTYEWFVNNVKQAETSTMFTQMFNASAVVSCSATDADVLEPKTATSTATITTYDASAVGTLIINTLPGAIVALHNTETLVPTETKTADTTGKATFAIAGTDRATFSISVGPDVVISADTVFQATLSELSTQLDYLCDITINETVPTECSTYDNTTFIAASSIPNALADLLIDIPGLTASDIDTNTDGGIDVTENYAFVLSDSDINSDGQLTWLEYRGNTDITSEFFVNVPVREYTIMMYAYGYEGIDEGYYGDKEWTSVASTVDFSGFLDSIYIYLNGWNAYTNIDGNATISSEYLFYGAADSLYSYTAKYIDENNATKYHLALDQTATDVANISLTPADFTLTGTEITFVNNSESSNISLAVRYNDEYIEYISSYNYNPTVLNDSRLTYNIRTSENSYDVVTGVSTYMSSRNYYGDGTLQTAYDITDYPNLDVQLSFTQDGTVSFSGNDISKVTTTSLNYYGYGETINGELIQGSNVNVTFNYTVMPTSLNIPILGDILPPVIAESLPQTMNYEYFNVSLSEFKGMDEAAFIDAVVANDYSYYDNGERYVRFSLKLASSVTAASTLKTEVKQRYARPFSIGFEPRPFVK